MMTKEGFTKNVNLMTLLAGFFVLGNDHMHISHIVKIHYFFSSFSVLWGMDQTNKVYTIDYGMCTIVNLMTPKQK